MNDYTKGWIRSSKWDVFWQHSGIWLTFLLLMLNPSQLQEMFYAVAVFLFWIAHRFSSFYLAWGTLAYKPLRRDQQKRFIILPLLIVLCVLAVLYMPESFSVFTVSERILGILLLDFAWGVHHFAAQHYGILRLYHHRWNPESAASANKQDRIFCWGVGGVLVIIAELLHGTSFLQEKHILPNLITDWGLEGVPMLLRLGTWLVVGSTFFMVRNAWLQDSGLPRILYLLGIGMMAVVAFQLDPFQFLLLWTLQHWLAAIGLAAHMGGNDVEHDEKQKSVSMKKYSEKTFWKPWLVLISLCVFSVIMTPFFEIEAVSAGGRYSEQVWPALMEWLQHSEWYTFLVGIGLASGFLHYWMDRAVFRFSDAQTRKSAQQLIFSS
ncbi:MAG: hypothetical protein P8L36_15265 [SAR324 cluster bacterium]|nr:hypothetical protein [SAR324 cluster bacterium]